MALWYIILSSFAVLSVIRGQVYGISYPDEDDDGRAALGRDALQNRIYSDGLFERQERSDATMLSPTEREPSGPSTKYLILLVPGILFAFIMVISVVMICCYRYQKRKSSCFSERCLADCGFQSVAPSRAIRQKIDDSPSPPATESTGNYTALQHISVSSDEQLPSPRETSPAEDVFPPKWIDERQREEGQPFLSEHNGRMAMAKQNISKLDVLHNSDGHNTNESGCHSNDVGDVVIHNTDTDGSEAGEDALKGVRDRDQCDGKDPGPLMTRGRFPPIKHQRIKDDCHRKTSYQKDNSPSLDVNEKFIATQYNDDDHTTPPINVVFVAEVGGSEASSSESSFGNRKSEPAPDINISDEDRSGPKYFIQAGVVNLYGNQPSDCETRMHFEGNIENVHVGDVHHAVAPHVPVYV